MKSTTLWQQGRLWLLLSAVLAAVALTVGWSSSGQKPQYPDFPIIFYQGEEVIKGREARFSSLLGGRPIVLNFWASNCPSCTRGLLEFQKVYEAYQDRVLFVGLDVGRFFGLGDEEDSKQELRRLGITYPAGTPPDIETMGALGVSGLPTTVFITPQGEKHRTWVEILNEKKLIELVESLLQASGPR